MSALIQHCADCSERLFPLRLLCPSCGGDALHLAPVDTAVVEQATRLADGTVLATVVPPGGPALVARLAGDAAVGHEVRLTNDAQAGPGQAYVPFTPTASDPLEDR